MTDYSITARDETGPLPPDDPTRTLAVSHPDDPTLPHICLVGDTYTVLVSGKQTQGRYCLLDMLVPDGGGPPPHRHDFEEMFTLLEGEIAFTFRGRTQTVKAPMTVKMNSLKRLASRLAAGQHHHLSPVKPNWRLSASSP